jgi:hypothetical protein
VLFRNDRWRDCSGSDVGGLTRAECRGARASVSKAQLAALDMRRHVSWRLGISAAAGRRAPVAAGS